MPVVPDPPSPPVSGWSPDLTCCPNWASYSAQAQQRAVTLAIGTLWALTGRQFGLSEVTAKPCNPPLREPVYQTYPVNMLNPWGTDGGGYYGPFIWQGEWHNVGCGGFDCCRFFCGLALDGPVQAIVSVSIDGVTLSPAAYSVENYYILRRIDGDCWPMCTDTFLVTYMRGLPVPDIANIALGDLACEYAAACTGADCNLPARITSLSRQGVSVDFTDPKLFADMGLTNVASVDRVVALLNPGGLRQPPVVMSPDVSPIRYPTWP